MQMKIRFSCIRLFLIPGRQRKRNRLVRIRLEFIQLDVLDLDEPAADLFRRNSNGISTRWRLSIRPGLETR